MCSFFTEVKTQGSTAKSDSIPPLSRYIISGGLMLTGLYLNEESRKRDVQEWVTDRWNPVDSKIDDYTQYMPLGILLLSNAFSGISSEEWKMQAKHILISQTTTLGVVYLLKYATDTSRPSGGSLSFPSGHTAHAFGAAAALHCHYKDKNKWLALSGYIPAIWTGVMRVARDKHWASDVLFGAGLGMITTYWTYHIIKKDKRRAKQKENRTNLSFGASQNGIGITMSWH